MDAGLMRAAVKSRSTRDCPKGLRPADLDEGPSLSPSRLSVLPTLSQYADAPAALIQSSPRVLGVTDRRTRERHWQRPSPLKGLCSRARPPRPSGFKPGTPTATISYQWKSSTHSCCTYSNVLSRETLAYRLACCPYSFGAQAWSRGSRDRPARL
jgi:hypothetical protein